MKATRQCALAMKNNNTLPILNDTLRVSLSARGASLSATDLTTYVRASVSSASGESKKSTTLKAVIPARQMIEWLSVFKSESPLTLGYDHEAARLTLRCVDGISSHTSSVVMFATDDYPLFPPTAAVVATLSAMAARRLCVVRRSVAEKKSGVIWRGINLRHAGAEIIASASDRYRIAQVSVPGAVDDGGQVYNETVDAESLAVLDRLLADETGPVHLYRSANHVCVQATGWTWWGALLEGNYPDVSNVPRGNERATFPAGAFREAVETTSVIARESDGTLAMSIRAQDRECDLFAVSSEVGDVQATIDCTASTSVQVGIAREYARDLFLLVENDEVEMFFSTPNAPLVFKGSGWLYGFGPRILP